MNDRTRSGSVLLLVLWAVVALSIITTNFAFMVRTHTRVTSNFVNDAVLLNIARGGVDYAVAVIKQDIEAVDHLGEEWADNAEVFYEQPLGDGLFTIELPALANHVQRFLDMPQRHPVRHQPLEWDALISYQRQ